MNLMLLIFLVGLSSTILSKDDKVTAFAGWEELKNDTLKIKAKSPKDWVIKSNADNDTIILSSDENIEGKDAVRIEIKSIDAFMHENDNVIFNRHIDLVQKNVKGFANLEKENEKFKTLPAISASYEFEEYEIKRKAILKYFRCNDKDYFYTFICATENFDRQISYFERVLESSTPFVFQKYPLFRIDTPKGWHEYTEEGFVVAASKEEDSRDISKGVMKVFVRKVDKELTLSNYTTQLISNVYDSTGASPALAITPANQTTGIQFQYFDLVDKDNILKERYLVYKYDQFVYVIYFIASTELFDQYKLNEFTKVLQSFSLVKEAK